MVECLRKHHLISHGKVSSDLLKIVNFKIDLSSLLGLRANPSKQMVSYYLSPKQDQA